MSETLILMYNAYGNIFNLLFTDVKPARAFFEAFQQAHADASVRSERDIGAMMFMRPIEAETVSGAIVVQPGQFVMCELVDAEMELVAARYFAVFGDQVAQAKKAALQPQPETPKKTPLWQAEEP